MSDIQEYNKTRRDTISKIYEQRNFQDLLGKKEEMKVKRRVRFVGDPEAQTSKKRVTYDDMPQLEEFERGKRQTAQEQYEEITAHVRRRELARANGENEQDEAFEEQRLKYNINFEDDSFVDMRIKDMFNKRDQLTDLKIIMSLLIIAGFQITLKAMNAPFLCWQKFCYISALQFSKNTKLPIDSPIKINYKFVEPFVDHYTDKDLIQYVFQLLYNNKPLVTHIFRNRESPIDPTDVEVSENLLPDHFRALYKLSENKRSMVAYGKRNFHTMYTYVFDNEQEMLRRGVQMVEDYYRHELEMQVAEQHTLLSEKYLPEKVVAQWQATEPSMRIGINLLDANQTPVAHDYAIAHTNYEPLSFDYKHLTLMTSLTPEEKMAVSRFDRRRKRCILAIFRQFSMAMNKVTFVVGRANIAQDDSQRDPFLSKYNRLRRGMIYNNEDTERSKVSKYSRATTVEDHVRDYAIIASAMGDINYYTELFFKKVYTLNCERLDSKKKDEPMSTRDIFRLMSFRKMMYISFFSAYYAGAAFAIAGDLGTAVLFFETAKGLIVKLMKKFPKIIFVFYVEMFYVMMAHLPSHPDCYAVLDGLKTIARTELDTDIKDQWAEFFERADAELVKNKALYDQMVEQENVFTSKLFTGGIIEPPPTEEQIKRDKEQQYFSDSDSENWDERSRRKLDLRALYRQCSGEDDFFGEGLGGMEDDDDSNDNNNDKKDE